MTTSVPVSDVQIALRPCQRDVLTTIEAAALWGGRRQGVSLPTGAGKTVIFAHLLVERQTWTLILVHCDELIRQTLDKLARVAQGTALDIGVIKAARDEYAGDVVVASMQPLQREARLQPHPPADPGEGHQHGHGRRGAGMRRDWLPSFDDLLTDRVQTWACTACGTKPIIRAHLWQEAPAVALVLCSRCDRERETEARRQAPLARRYARQAQG